MVIAVAFVALSCDVANQWWQERQLEKTIASITRCCFGRIANKGQPIRAIPPSEEPLARLEGRPLDQARVSEMARRLRNLQRK
jgi:hypothetical protein